MQLGPAVLPEIDHDVEAGRLDKTGGNLRPKTLK
jgi:hypothetical protein